MEPTLTPSFASDHRGTTVRPMADTADVLGILHHDLALLGCLLRLASALAFPTSGHRGEQAVGMDVVVVSGLEGIRLRYSE
jgi:hypothetical protein